jgi:hypothetical protein
MIFDEQARLVVSHPYRGKVQAGFNRLDDFPLLSPPDQVNKALIYFRKKNCP